MFSTKTRRVGTIRMAGAAMTIAAVGTVWSVAAAQNTAAQQQASQGAGAASTQQTDGLSVGTYKPQEAFRQYHRTQAFQQEVRQLQQQAQEDPQQAIQMQQQLQQKQQQLVQQFQQDVKTAVPEVAKSEDVKLVVARIVYADPAVRSNVKDLTPQITEKINEGAATQQQPNQLGTPGGLQQQQQGAQQEQNQQQRQGLQQGQQQQRQGLQQR